MSKPPETIGRATLWQGDCREVLATFDADSIDAVVTDPPAGISFMGRDWDHHRGGRAQWIAWMETIATECLRVAKPGAHALVWALPRTSHWTATAWENAGWEVRDRLAYLFGSGFPKSHDVSKAMDKTAGQIGQSVISLKRHLATLVKMSGKTGKQIDAECGFRAMNYLTLPGEAKRPDPWTGVLPPFDKWLILKAVIGAPEDVSLDAAFSAAEREILGVRPVHAGVAFTSEGPTELDITAPATPEAARWSGWGTALKPACEDWWLLRKPLIGTVAQNVLAHGTGGLNIDGCRVASDGGRERDGEASRYRRYTEHGGTNFAALPGPRGGSPSGRFPANLLHDGSDEVEAAFPQSNGQAGAIRGTENNATDNGWRFARIAFGARGDTGSAARFFASCPFSADELRFHYSGKADADDRAGSKHPTIKPISLMRWLVRLITPSGGTVLDCFAGSGTTGEAAMLEGCNAVLIEREATYMQDIRHRLGRASGADTPLFADTA